VLPASSPIKELRKQKLLASDSPLIPDEMRRSTSETYEIWQATEEEMEEGGPTGDSFRDDFWGYGYEFDPTRTDERGRAGTHEPPLDPSVATSSSTDTTPAPISVMPTSSIFPMRPRTVAAGYAPDRKVLTVMFRDGTMYNYYDVFPTTWFNFRRAHSKGQFIKRFLDGHRRGAAGPDADLMKSGHLEALYRVARTAQVLANGLQRGQKNDAKRTRSWNKSSYAVRGKSGSMNRKANVSNRQTAWDNKRWSTLTPAQRQNLQRGRPY
jgi:hypothetical protein